MCGSVSGTIGQLREDLAVVTAERDALVTTLTGIRDMSQYDQDDFLRLKAAAKVALERIARCV